MFFRSNLVSAFMLSKNRNEASSFVMVLIAVFGLSTDKSDLILDAVIPTTIYWMLVLAGNLITELRSFVVTCIAESLSREKGTLLSSLYVKSIACSLL